MKMTRERVTSYNNSVIKVKGQSILKLKNRSKLEHKIQGDKYWIYFILVTEYMSVIVPIYTFHDSIKFYILSYLFLNINTKFHYEFISDISIEITLQT